MGTYDTSHGGPISPDVQDPYIFSLEEEVLGILEDAGVTSDVYDRVVKAARKTLVEYEARIESLSAQLAALKRDYSRSRGSLSAQVAELKKDAERYRWLREQNKDPVYADCVVINWNVGHEWTTANDLDAAIDAAKEGK